MNNILTGIKEAEARISLVKSCLNNSRYLSGLENTAHMLLDFNPYSLSLKLILRANYRRLVDALVTLRKEGAVLEFDHVFDCGEEFMFVYGSGALEVNFYCNKNDIPDQLQQYVGRN